MNRSLMLLSILGTLLSACGGNEGLTMLGGVEVTGAALNSSIGPFDQAIRLDALEATGTGRITGRCEMRRVLDADGVQQWSAMATIAAPTDAGLSSITISQDTGALPEAAVVTAVITSRQFASGATGCAIEVPYALGSPDGMVQMMGNCQLVDVDGVTVDAAIDLTLEGCLVADGTD